MECPVPLAIVHATFGVATFGGAELLEFAFFISTPKFTLPHTTWIAAASMEAAVLDSDL
jgi:hypothetical protein